MHKSRSARLFFTKSFRGVLIVLVILVVFVETGVGGGVLDPHTQRQEARARRGPQAGMALQGTTVQRLGTHREHSVDVHCTLGVMRVQRCYAAGVVCRERHRRVQCRLTDGNDTSRSLGKARTISTSITLCALGAICARDARWKPGRGPPQDATYAARTCPHL